MKCRHGDKSKSSLPLISLEKVKYGENVEMDPRKGAGDDERPEKATRGIVIEVERFIHIFPELDVHGDYQRTSYPIKSKIKGEYRQSQRETGFPE